MAVKVSKTETTYSGYAAIKADGIWGSGNRYEDMIAMAEEQGKPFCAACGRGLSVEGGHFSS